MKPILTFGLTYSRMRWMIAALLTIPTILIVIDQQTLSVLAPVLRDRFHISAQGYSTIVSGFLISFAVMYTVGGMLVDRIGERTAMAAFIIWFSICTILGGLSRGPWTLGISRFLLGIGQPGNYPAALRACTRWFPKAERGLPIALFSSGGAIGSIIAPPIIVALSLTLGWRAAFFLPGLLGFIWLALWLAIYRFPQDYPGISSSELQQLDVSQDHIGATEAQQWSSLWKDRNVLALVLARFVSDPVWIFYLFWIPEYLKRERGFSLADIGLYAWIPFVGGAMGGMVGGRVSDMLIARGMPAAKARSRILYISAAIAPFGMLTSRVHSAAIAIFLISIMAFVAFSWFINTAAIIPDLFSEKVVGSVLGFMGTAGTLGGVLFSTLVGFLLTHYSYTPVFILAGTMHLFASFILWFLLRLQRAPAQSKTVLAV
ncbi:MAG TPA: MFS transporter [Candidatus Binatus sp.]|nr:MFS transporter [Candidatus Binatus sp.]